MREAAKPFETRHPFSPLLQGCGASPGIIAGGFWVMPRLSDLSSSAVLDHGIFHGVEIEVKRFREAQSLVLADLKRNEEKARLKIGDDEAAIFETHQMMLQDDEIQGKIELLIENEKINASESIRKTFQEQVHIFSTSESEYLRGRVLDLKDIEGQLLNSLVPQNQKRQEMTVPSILVAENLTPSQTLSLDAKMILALVTEEGTNTSHTAILARAMGIPAIVGAKDLFKKLANLDLSARVAVDGEEGTVFKIQSSDEIKYFTAAEEKARLILEANKAFKGRKTLTSDGCEISLYANIGGEKEMDAVHAESAEGVGLFRTEFLFMEKATSPTFEEQRSSYSKVLNSMAQGEVVIRTLDVGGDKPISYLPFPKEENPFMGMRAVRFCMKNLDFFAVQIKAMLSANENGNLSILLPMISSASEAKEIVQFIRQCEQELLKNGSYVSKPYRIGAMLEIPSLVFELPELANVVSFISVGTNDLLQYTLAVDRMNSNLQSLYSPYHLGFLRMMNKIAGDARKQGLEVGICGELGGNTEFIPLWIGMGFQKLSMSPKRILLNRASISKISSDFCEKLKDQVLNAKNETEVKMILKRETV